MINDAQAVRFTNEQARVLADQLSAAYWTAKRVLANYYSDVSLGDAFSGANASLVVDDGATADGRPIVTGNDVLGIVTRASEIVADMEETSNAKLNTVLALAVNGNSRV